MTTYTLNPNATWLAVYNLNTGTMPTNNVVFSELTADIWKNDTSITLKTGEWALFTWWMVATIEQLQDDWKTATAREVVLISWINGDTLTITRWYEKCVMNDTATPKVMWNEKQTFTSWARISVYVSKALLNWVQTRLAQVNCPCNTQVYNDSLAISSCVANNCDDWRDKLYSEKARRCYNDCWFGDWSDWDCVITQNTFLCANCDYNFKNLTICKNVLVRFMWAWTPRINVQRRFCNMWTIDLRWWTFVWACSKVDWITGCTVSNNACSTCYNAMCYGCWWAWWSWYTNWTAWANATTSWWWVWWNGGCWLSWNVRYIWNYEWREEYTCSPWACWWSANWNNGWCGWVGWSAWWDAYCWYYPQGRWWGGWWGGWWWYFEWNWWDWWAPWYAVYNVCRYSNWWNWWNGWIWWKGWKWWWPWTALHNYCSFSYCYNNGWNGWNWYIGWDWWRWDDMLCYAHWNWWNGWRWVVCWWNGADSWKSNSNRPNNFHAWNWWQAINNMYWLILHACEYYNCCIMAKGWDWWRWWNAIASDWSWQWSTHWASWWCGWCGGCGANGWHVSVAYVKLLNLWSINTSKWLWWKGWCNRCVYDCITYCADWTDWAEWWNKVIKPF